MVRYIKFIDENIRGYIKEDYEDYILLPPPPPTERKNFQSLADPCLYIKKVEPSEIVILIVWVDHIISETMIEVLENQFFEESLT